MTYVDDDHPVSVAAEFRAMVDAQPAILNRFPTLDRHMRRYPEASPDTDDILYWSKEKLGPEVVVSVTHLAVARLAGSEPARFAAASRQIYGSQYFDASLGITMVLEDAARPAGSYLVYVNRSRLDALGGFFGPMKRLIVRSRTRSAMSKTLLEVRDLVERRFASAPTR